MDYVAVLDEDTRIREDSACLVVKPEGVFSDCEKLCPLTVMIVSLTLEDLVCDDCRGMHISPFYSETHMEESSPPWVVFDRFIVTILRKLAMFLPFLHSFRFNLPIHRH
jgi:hypothetical protein